MKTQVTAESHEHQQSGLAPAMQTGHVSLVGPENIAIKTPLGTYTATVAASCLLQPQLGDEVLFAQTEFGSSIIIAIIKQANANQQTYKLNQQISFSTDNGALSINTTDFTAVSTRSANIISPTLQLQAVNAEANFKNYNLTAEFFQSSVAQMQNFVSVLDETIKTYHLNSEHLFQRVSELQHQVLGQLHTLVEHHYRLDCENADFYAEGDVKMDAQQILLG